MMKFWNPIEAYRKASQKNAEAQTRHEAHVKICRKDGCPSRKSSIHRTIYPAVIFRVTRRANIIMTAT